MTDTPIADEPTTATVTNSRVAHHGAVWDILVDHFDYNGTDTVREYMSHPGAVAVYAEDDKGRVLVIQQYRHPVRLREWEIPAGLRDIAGEDPLDAAKRELAEEADIAASDWQELVRFHTTPGGSNEQVIVYRARGLSATEPFAREDEEADIVKRWVPRDDIVDGALEGRLSNSILVLSALAVDAAERRRS